MNLPPSQNGPYKVKHAHSCINTELLKVNTPYAFSFNPKDISPQRYGEDLFKATTLKTYKYFHNALTYFKVTMYPETSPVGRIHYHGTIEISNIAMFMLKDMPELQALGTYEIDTISGIVEWTKYCTKQMHIWKPFAISLKLPYIIESVQLDGKQLEVDLPKKAKKNLCLDLLD